VWLCAHKKNKTTRDYLRENFQKRGVYQFFIMADDDKVQLQSSDAQTFTVTVSVAKMSETVRNLIEDAGIDNAIPLPNVTGKILSKVTEYCTHHVENPEPVADEDKKEENYHRAQLAFKDTIQKNQDFRGQVQIGVTQWVIPFKVNKYINKHLHP